MYFGDFARAIALWVGSLATAYTLVFFHAVAPAGHGLRLGTMVLILLAVGAVLFIVRNSKQWGFVLGAALFVSAACRFAIVSLSAPPDDLSDSAEQQQHATLHL
jgi:hypothetical protein